MKYKNNAIRLTADNEFTCDELDLTAPTYKGLCALLDKQTKQTFERIPALYMDGFYGDSTIKPVTITSIVPNRYGNDSDYVHITKANNRREKVRITRLYADTPANRKIAKRIEALHAKHTALKAQIDLLKETLAPAELPKVKP